MIINSFFDKNNTIISDSLKNTANNPVSELFYGGPNKKHSRFIFKVDLSRLEMLINDGYISDISKLTHSIKMVNTGFFDWNLAGNDFLGKNRTSSFDLGLYPISQSWDSGVGYDEQLNGLDYGVSVYSELPSNWYSATTINLWGEEGSFSGNTYINTQHFEYGNENLEMDVTDEINSILSGMTNNYGFGLKFLNEYENLVTEKLQYVGFFTNKTNTIYVPYLQTKYNDLILDDRFNFKLNKINRLYFYSYVGGELTNLDEFPTVQIFDSNNQLLESFSSNEVNQYGKGVYYAELIVPNLGQDDCTIYYDTWSNIKLNGIDLPSVELDFTLKQDNVNFGVMQKTKQDISITVSGIFNGEKLNRGVLRDVNILPKIKYSNNQLDQNLTLYYRIYVKEGNSEIPIFEYSETNSLMYGEKNFKLDTMSLLPATYFMDIKWVKNGNINIAKEILTFEVVNETQFRISQ